MADYYMGKDGFYWFVGVVEDRNDPKKLSRVRVRVLGAHTGDTSSGSGIPTEDLPWAHVLMPVTAGANSGVGVSPHFLVEGTWVMGFFRDVHLQEPVIMGALPGVNNQDIANTIHTTATKKSSDYKGFKDPGTSIKPEGGQDVTYPASLYVAKPDTNLLAQENSHTHKGITARTESDKKVKWTTASSSSLEGSKWKPTNSESKYPYNHVFESEAGHIIEVDDTKGNERIHVYHKTGTYIEIDKDGNMRLDCLKDFTQVVRGDMHTYVVGNQSLTVDGTSDWKVGELVTELFAKGRKTTISEVGDTVAITGDVKIDTVGALTETVSMAVKQTYSLTAEIKASMAMTIGGSTVSFN